MDNDEHGKEKRGDGNKKLNFQRPIKPPPVNVVKRDIAREIAMANEEVQDESRKEKGMKPSSSGDDLTI